MTISSEIFTLLYSLTLVFCLIFGYIIGRKSRTQDIEFIADMLTQGVYEETQPTRHRARKVRWNPKNQLDPIEPEQQEREAVNARRKGGIVG